MKVSKTKVLKKTAIITIPILLIWIGIISYNLKTEEAYIIDNLVAQNEAKDSNTEFLVDTYIDEIIEDLKLVRGADEFQEFINKPTDASRLEAQSMFVRVMENKEDYDQLRMIDAEGYELIRVDNQFDTETSPYPIDQLQDKSERYYFEGTKALNYDEIFISPLDLNVENGLVEIPHKPMVRFATPLYDDAKNFAGVLIINYKAAYFVNILKEHEAHQKVEDFWFYVVNRHGEFIIHQEDDLNFSFMFNESKDMNFSQVDEAVWEEIETSDKGSVFLSNKLITYHDVLTKTRSKHPKYEERWIAIHEMDMDSVYSVKAVIEVITSVKNLSIAILIMVMSFLFAYISEKLIKKDSRLEMTEMIATSTNDGVMITDVATKITYVNRAFEEITGYGVDEVIGMEPRKFKSGKQNADFYVKMWHDINTKGFWEGMLWDKKKNGALYPQKMKIIAFKNKNGGVHHYISVFTDMSIHEHKMARIKDIDRKDGDLFIPNEDMMIQLLQENIKDEKFSFMVLYIAIENYNQLITSFVGFEAKITELFIDIVKPLVHEDDFIAETGRNVFAVIVGMQHMDENPKAFVNNIHKNLSRIIEVNGRELFFKTRMGVAFWPNDTDDLKKILLNSIIALEWSNSRQAQEIAFYKKEMIQELNQENEIEGHLRSAIDKKELRMVYQPQVNSSSNEVIGVEALIRWNSDKLGFVPPSVFIPIAERSNLIIEIGYWIVRQVCQDLKEILPMIPDSNKNIRCAINLSAIQLQEGAFLDKLFTIFDQSHVSYKNLEIEITESLLLSNQEKSVEMLESMQGKGLKIAIDDFGTGYSSLSYLKTLPINKIKIDRSFIKDYPEKDDGKLARVLINMAESLGMDVLTEGAETLEQVKFLQGAGCDSIQGYYYSKPLEKADFISFLNNR